MGTIDFTKGLRDGISSGRLISIVYRYHSYCLSKSLSKYNLGKGEYKVLIQIYKEEGICQDNIADVLKVDKFRVAKAIKQLIEKGYVYKVKDKKDKRKHNIYLTEKSLKIKDEFIDVLEQNSDVMVEGFSEEEKEIINKLLIKMGENLCKEAEKIKNN